MQKRTADESAARLPPDYLRGVGLQSVLSNGDILANGKTPALHFTLNQHRMKSDLVCELWPTDRSRYVGLSEKSDWQGSPRLAQTILSATNRSIPHICGYLNCRNLLLNIKLWQ